MLHVTERRAQHGDMDVKIHIELNLVLRFDAMVKASPAARFYLSCLLTSPLLLHIAITLPLVTLFARVVGFAANCTPK
jgi:hypothetical protein